MTEEEAWLVHDVKEAYWKAFSQVVKDHLLKVPMKLRPNLAMQMEDASSVHGSKYFGQVVK